MDHPNVLLITADQWPGALLEFAGREDIETPTLNQIAKNGVWFPNAHSECPICIPARRTLMTGTSPRIHGDRVFQPTLPRPSQPHFAEVFREKGYQTGSVGKLHVFPPRDRIGFEETVLYEEGRPGLGGPDDWDLYLADVGATGLGYGHGMSNNSYEFRSWHLDEASHPTVWLTRQMSRMICRRDPTRPQFWNLSFNFPHPPIVPLANYLTHYQERNVVPALEGAWNDDLPYALERAANFWPTLTPERLASVRRAFYAQCTLIDHQIRTVIGTLRENGILDETIIAFTSDHGEMLGDHGFFSKRLFLANSNMVPLIVMGTFDSERVVPGKVDRRLAGLQDVMPTLLDLCGIDIPESCSGNSLFSDKARDYLYCEVMEGPLAMRMIADGRWKLIWYPAGNRFQLFDRNEDPYETRNLADSPKHEKVRNELKASLVQELYGEDLEWIEAGELVGFPQPELPSEVNRGLWSQRGIHYPQPPSNKAKPDGAPSA